MLIKDIMDEIYAVVKDNYRSSEEAVETIKRLATLKAIEISKGAKTGKETGQAIVLEALARLLVLEHRKAKYAEAKYQNLQKLQK